MEKKTKKLILIDGNAIIHRSYHALPPLTTKSGELVNAVYGFSSTILSVIAKFQPDYIVATFDLAGPTFRHVEYEEYKATRVKADQALYDQIPRVKEVVRAMDIPIFEQEGFEADDLIGTLAARAEKEHQDLEIIIVTGDLDTLQLISPKTKVYTMRRGLTDAVLYDEKAVRERYHLAPTQMIDYKGLRGDASDNIPGVKGIGEKTAVELLEKYGTLEEVYKNLSEIKGAIKEKLERDKVIAIQSKHLATINRQVPIDFDLEKAKTHQFDREKIVRLFQSLNFFSLIKRLPGNGTSDTKIRPNDNANGENVDGVKDFKYEYITPEKVDKFLEEAGEQKEIAIKLRTAGARSLEASLMGLAISWKTGRAGYLEYDEENRSKIKKLLEDKNIIKIGYNLKKDLKVLSCHEIDLSGTFFDIMLADYVLEPRRKSGDGKIGAGEFRRRDVGRK